MNNTTLSALPALPLHRADLRGLWRLGVDGTVGITDLVEAMHHTIASRVGFGGHAVTQRTHRTTGLTGLIYRSVRGGTRLWGRAGDAALRLVERRGPVPEVAAPERDAFVAALNGLFGDHLAASDNPLAIRMALRQDGVALNPAGLSGPLPRGAPSGKLLLLLHGLCMNDRQWARRGHDHGAMLARERGMTPLYLNYNSGRHVSQNGRELAALLQQLVAHWPVPVEELVIVGHSMGGLVARSACHHADIEGQAWLRYLTKLVCLGTPHHGAPLERGGRRIDLLLGLSPYVAPFARLGKARSAGITDLRFGNLQDADWSGRDRHAQHHDDRQPTPLPRHADTFLLAATLAERPGRMHSAVIGDGLVPLASALGEHREAALALRVPAEHRHIVTECGHLDLLCHPQVQARLLDWLSAPAAAPR